MLSNENQPAFLMPKWRNCDGQAFFRSPLLLVPLMMVLLAASAFAQKPKQPNPLAPKAYVAPQPAQLPSTGAHELTAADLEAFWTV